MLNQPSPNEENGRDATGRFAKGNAGGPGNPYARRTARLRSLIAESVTDEDLQAIVSKLVDDAKQGDQAAVKLLLSYLVGKPGEAVDPDRVELDDAKLATERVLAELRGVMS